MPAATAAVIAIAVSAATFLSINGSAPELNRTTYFNMHGKLNNEWHPTDPAIVASRNITFGRSFLASRVLKYAGNGQKLNRTQLAQACREKIGAETIPAYAAPFARLGPGAMSYIESVNPMFYYRDGHDDGFAPNGNWTLAAEAYVAYLELCTSFASQPGRMVEAMNEPWGHNTPTDDIIAAYVALKAELARRIPAGRVTGPTAAGHTLNLQVPGKFANISRFIDEAGPVLDGLSFHLYEQHVPTTGRYRTRRIGTNIEATLDAIEYMSLRALGHVLPYSVSEFGAGFYGWRQEHAPADNATAWAQCVSTIGMWLSFLERPDAVLKTVPFILYASTEGRGGNTSHPDVEPFDLFTVYGVWNGSGYTMKTAPRSVMHLYGLLAGVTGSRVASETWWATGAPAGGVKAAQRNVQVAAYYDNTTGVLSTIVNNLDPTWSAQGRVASKEVHLRVFGMSDDDGGASSRAVTVKALRRGETSHAPEYTITEHHTKDDGTLVLWLQPEECVVVEARGSLIHAPTMRTQYRMHADLADAVYRQPIVANATMAMPVAVGGGAVDGVNVSHATLRVCVAVPERTMRWVPPSRVAIAGVVLPPWDVPQSPGWSNPAGHLGLLCWTYEGVQKHVALPSGSTVVIEVTFAHSSGGAGGVMSATLLSSVDV